MADVKVTTKTAITREHFVPEVDVITLLKLDMGTGGVLTEARLVGVDGVNMVKFISQEPEQVTDAVIPL